MSGIQESSDRSDVVESAYVSGTLSVTTSAIEAKVGANRLTGRQILSIYNAGPGTIYVGPSGVTSSTGRPIFRDQSIDMPAGNVAVFLIAGTGTQSVIVQELS